MKFNTGYILLGLIIERVSSESLDEFFREKIFSKYSMLNSVVYQNAETKIAERAFGYLNDRLNDQNSTSATRGDGGIYSSLNDYFNWFRNVSWRNFPFSTSKSVRCPNGDEFFYNFGWFHSDIDGRTRLHVGDSSGFTHQVYQIDEDQRKVLVIYLSNIGQNQKKIEEFNRFLFEHFPSLTPRCFSLLLNLSRLTC